MAEKRVFITGCGVISPIGIGAGAFWNSLCTGAISAGRGAEGTPLARFNVEKVLGSKGLRRVGRTNGLLLAAAALALDGAEKGARHLSRDDIGVVTAAGMAGTGDFASFRELVSNRAGVVEPGNLLGLYRNLFTNAASANIAIRFGLRGPGAALWGGRLAGMEAFSYARRLLLQGRAGGILLGAVEVVTPLLERLLKASSAATDHDSQATPRKTGMSALPGEVAVALFLQAEEHAGHVVPGALCSVDSMVTASAEDAGDYRKAAARAARGALLGAGLGVGEALVSEKGANGLDTCGEEVTVLEGQAGAGRAVASISLASLVGNCYSATGPLALAMAALLLSSGRLPLAARRLGEVGRPGVKPLRVRERKRARALVCLSDGSRAFATVLEASGA